MNKPCGCCGGIQVATPETEYNRPGLPDLRYREGTYATFFESMLARLSSTYLDIDSGTGGVRRIYPLKDLTTRELSDPSIALLDAWAVVADVLTFYQERIANEGYLATATERLSVLELARLIGYRPRPGVASSVFLAFTTSVGFKGQIPAGTRAQSVPGGDPGDTPQFFESSTDLMARETWNSLRPRLTRPQVISPPIDPALKFSNHLGTNADVVDGLYFQGVANNLKAGDALLLVLSQDADMQFLRFVEAVDVQATQSRTHVDLLETPLDESGDLKVFVTETLQRFVYDAPDQFAGSDLAASTAALLQEILAAMSASPVAAATAARAAAARIQALHDVAVKRKFTRVEVWLQHLVDGLPRVLDALAKLTEGTTGTTTVVRLPPRPSVTVSSLERLGGLLPTLSLERSVPPVNPLRMARSVATSFSAHADTMPRLLAVLHPVAASVIYKAWGNVEPVHIDQAIYALRAKASLFASNFAGVPTFNRLGRIINFTAATLNNTWGDLITQSTTQLSVIALDAVYDKITPSSWISVSRPVIGAAGVPVGRVVTSHKVTGVQTTTLDTTTGFTAKVSILTLNTPWLSAGTPAEFTSLAAPPLVLRGTVVYTQSEQLGLAEEPLDRDVQGDSIELDGLYDGLEPGRWVIVSGERTDIPNVSGVTASELAMISSVSQGAGKEVCQPFLPGFVPFESLFYISDENKDGDRLVVGVPTSLLFKAFKTLPIPQADNQQYCEAIELAPGVYANAYVPTDAERGGDFSAFKDQLFDPGVAPAVPFGGFIPLNRIDRIFAWRIRNLTSGSETVHTTIQLAKALAYKYDSAQINIYANVVKATNGQTTGEILGDGDGSQAFQSFTLHQKPLTYLPAATQEGTQSTLTVRVNDIERQETDSLAALEATDRDYVTQTDDADQTTIVFGNGEHGARVPTGSSNVKATYRYGIGSAGNVDAGQISQLSTHPLGLQGVVNPLPATGGADRDTLEQVRRNAPLVVMALDRLVSIQDYADFARTYAGIGKAVATLLSDGRRQMVHLTIAGAGDVPIDQTSDLYQNFLLSLESFGDPFQPVQVCVRKVRLLVISAGIQLQSGYLWESVEPQIRAALLAGFNFDARDLGQPAFLSEAVAMMQGVEGVLYVDVRIFDSVGEDVTPAQLTQLATTLQPNPYVQAGLAQIDPKAAPDADPCTRIRAAELVYLTPEIPDTLILTQVGA